MDDFTPWPMPTATMHFNVEFNGHLTAARVTRECLSDHKLVDETMTREQFAASPIADRLRQIAVSKLKRGGGAQPLVTSDDWADGPGQGNVQDPLTGAWLSYTIEKKPTTDGLACQVFLDDGTGRRIPPYNLPLPDQWLSKSAEGDLVARAMKVSLNANRD